MTVQAHVCVCVFNVFSLFFSVYEKDREDDKACDSVSNFFIHTMYMYHNKMCYIPTIHY